MWRGTNSRCGFGRRIGTLLGPETTSDGRFGRESRADRGPRSGDRWLGLTKRSGVWCWLRIAQWMRASLLLCGQVAEGVRWMPWHQEPMKDVGGRDRPGGAVNRAVIPGCPNGGTRHQSCGVTPA